MRPWVDENRHAWVHRPSSDDEWTQLSIEYSGPEREPLDQVFDVVRAGGARTVVIENRYVDIDYRSEYSAFWSLKFDGQSPFGRRFHFFATDLSEDGLHDLSEAERDSYLGYSVIRPVEYGRVGRTVLRRPPQLSDATLTEITDTVSFFGTSLKVTGAPFCQQDSEFLRCAQAAVWICHYSAHRRQLVGRASTAEIVDLSPAVLSPERALPSKGMTLNQLQAVFGSLGQPALFYGLSNMPQVPGVKDPTPPGGDQDDETPAGYWDDRLESVICRYLNSDFPVLIGAEDHAFILVGWRRGPDGRVQFIACDDQKGPYEVIDSPFAHYKTPWDSIMIPLPPRVFLSAESAEGRAHKVFRSMAENAEQLDWLAEGLLDASIVLRTRLITGASFKERISGLTSSEEILRMIRYARLPHWVWVVEAHDKKLCVKGEPCVHAAAVFDSTSYDRAPPIDVLAMPAFVAVYPPDGAEIVKGDGSVDPWDSLLDVH